MTTIWRKLQLPDPLRVRRYEALPEFGPRILFFSGGSALNKISRILKRYSHNSIHLVTPFDSGGSSARLREAFSMPAIGDLRSRLMALADETVLGQPEIYRLFHHRFPLEADTAWLQAQLTALVMGHHDLIQPITEPMRQLIRTQLAITASHLQTDFDLRGASIGNLIIAGGYLNNQQQLDPIVFLFSRLVKVLGEVKTITDSAYHLAAELENGQYVLGQHRLTGKECAPLQSRIKRIFLNDGLSRVAPVRCQLAADRQEQIEQADLICYPPGSFYSSLLVNLLPDGVGQSIMSNPNPKVYLPNLGLDPEQIGLGLYEQVEHILATAPTSLSGRMLDFVVVDTHVAMQKRTELAKIEALGVSVLSAPLANSAGDRYDEYAVTKLLLSLS